MTADHDPIAERLASERPVARDTFRRELRGALLADADARFAPPSRPWLVIAAYAGSGLALLVVGVLSLAGVGPLGA